MAQPSSSYYTSTLDTLRTQQATHPLSILSLAEPIITSTTTTNQSHTHDQRISDSNASSETPESLTPATLTADLTHYRDLFSKLRFSYLEQVTKEKYLRSIVGDPPILVSHADNVKLEDELAGMKNVLSAKKEGVANMVEDLDGKARELAGRYEGVQRGIGEFERRVSDVEGLELRKAELEEQIAKRTRLAGDENVDPEPRMNMSLAQTTEAIGARERENKELDAQIAALQRQLPNKMRECEAVERELDGLERRRDESASLAREARRIKEEGARDRVEELGRWYRSAEIVMKGMGLETSSSAMEVEAS